VKSIFLFNQNSTIKHFLHFVQTSMDYYKQWAPSLGLEGYVNRFIFALIGRKQLDATRECFQNKCINQPSILLFNVFGRDNIPAIYLVFFVDVFILDIRSLPSSFSFIILIQHKVQ